MTSPLELTSPDPDAGVLLRLADHDATMRRAGACEHPLLLSGTRLVVEADTGRVVHRLDTTDPSDDADHPDAADRVAVLRCRNRRATVCPACSALYKLDAYHLMVAGLRGGKNVPDTVTQHPRLLITLTAPSFGLVHSGPNRAGAPRLCHPGTCGRWHPAGDTAIGTALDPHRYDYTRQVLFNAYAGALWASFATGARRALATAAGLSRKDAAAVMRVVFAKVAEFQGRGVVHFHAIVRLDGTDGSACPPPSWASVSLLRRSVRTAARQAATTTAGSTRFPARVLRFGRQLDIRPITATATNTATSDVVVARYVAKYATKSAETAGLNLAPICCHTCHGTGTGICGLCRTCAGTGRRRGLHLDELTDHARTLVETCWRLGSQPEYAPLRLRRHAHQAGYRGHFCTKSRNYSTTFTALRAERQAWATAQLLHRLGITETGPLMLVNDWRYHGRADEPTPHHRSPGDG